MEFVTAKSVVKALVNPLIDICGVYDALLSRRVFARPSWLILMYHRVVETPAADPFRLGMCVERAHFAEQIDFLTQVFTPITVAEAMQRMREGRPLPRNAVSITFDDGYRDFVDIAQPVLRRLGCPATLYVSTDGIEQRRHFWWDRVIASFAGTRRDQLLLNIPQPAGGEGKLLRIGLGNRRRAVLQVLDTLWRLPAHEIERQLAVIETDLAPVRRIPAADRLGLDDVAAFDPEEVEIAAHGETHIDMRLMSPEELDADVTASRARLRQAAGREIDGFAYPGGRQDERVQQLVRRAGFTYAAGTDKGVNRQPFAEFNLRRIGTPDTTIAELKRCLSMAAGDESAIISGESVQWP